MPFLRRLERSLFTEAVNSVEKIGTFYICSNPEKMSTWTSIRLFPHASLKRIVTFGSGRKHIAGDMFFVPSGAIHSIANTA